MSKRFTLEPVEWAAWLPPVDAATATPRQRAALDASPQRDSPYFLTLAHDVDSLEQRSPLFHAVMYAPRGLPRADRELATVVVSIINGCVYCSSVHARRFVELTKRPDVILAPVRRGTWRSTGATAARHRGFRRQTDARAAGDQPRPIFGRCARSAWTTCRSTT